MTPYQILGAIHPGNAGKTSRLDSKQHLNLSCLGNYGILWNMIWLLYMHVSPLIISGWWLTYPSEKYEFVTWDDDIPNTGKNTIHVPNHQPVMEYYGILMNIIGYYGYCILDILEVAICRLDCKWVAQATDQNTGCF